MQYDRQYSITLTKAVPWLLFTARAAGLLKLAEVIKKAIISGGHSTIISLKCSNFDYDVSC